MARASGFDEGNLRLAPEVTAGAEYQLDGVAERQGYLSLERVRVGHLVPRRVGVGAGDAPGVEGRTRRRRVSRAGAGPLPRTDSEGRRSFLALSPHLPREGTVAGDVVIPAASLETVLVEAETIVQDDERFLGDQGR